MFVSEVSLAARKVWRYEKAPVKPLHVHRVTMTPLLKNTGTLFDVRTHKHTTKVRSEG